MTSDRTVVPPAWFLKAVIINGRDTIDTPLNFDSDADINDVQIVMTQKRTELTGNAVDTQNTAVTDYAVVLFPENQALWTGRSRYIGTARPDQKGQFKVTGLPPGRYLAAAVDYLAVSEERDPDLLARLKDRATAVTLLEGEAKRVTVPVTLR
jgi:hypothetical protein